MSRLLNLLLLLAVSGVANAAGLPDNWSGTIKGTSLPNHKYTVVDSIIINAGDTLTISAGDTILMASPTGWVHIFGTLICAGTKQNPNLFTVPAPRDTAPGQWGGIVGDSCNYFQMTWTKILWAGGNNTGGHAYRTIDIYSDYQNKTTTVFTDNTVIGTVDDCIGLHGGNASVLRNTIKWCGAPDGDNINVKDGTIGEIAYNVIWGSGGNGIKLNSSPDLLRLTNMVIHNNTIVAGGWRRVEELGYAILVDNSSRAQIYNNIMGDLHQELEITVAADTARTVYDNNLFFASVDSLLGSERFWASDGVARQMPHDKVYTSAGSPFVKYHPYFDNDWNALDGDNDYRIKSNSMAAGNGFTPPISWVNPFFPGQQLPGAVNMGALDAVTTADVPGHVSTVSAPFALDQNYPNPFNPSTRIGFSIPNASHVTLIAFNALGQHVATLLDAQLAAGAHQVVFDGSKLSSGLYFYRLITGARSLTGKMMLVK